MRRRPCRICRRWFSPHPRLGERQMTCGDSRCKREWHRKRCAQWNRKNVDYFKTNYLQKKLEALPGSKTQGVLTRFHSKLLREKVQEVIGAKHLVIIEYLLQLVLKRFQELISVQVAVNTG